MEKKSNVYSYQYDELTSDESSLSSSSAERIRSAEKRIDDSSLTPKQEPVLPEFKQLMVVRKNETAEFKNMILSLALIMVSVGLVANVLFNLLIVCRKRKRQTATTLVMFSMCSAYLIYLCFYCLKLSVYFNGDSITKFHMYDTIDNWVYGAFLCRFISGLPFCCKLISRLSILTLVCKRFLNIFVCDCSSNADSKECSQADSDEIDTESSKLNHAGHHASSKSSNQTNEISQAKTCCKKLHLIKQMFEWPILIVLISCIWLISVCVSLPIFKSFKLNEPSQNSIQTSRNICNSVFRFPEDINSVSEMHFGYLVYGLLVPSGVIFVCLIGLFLMQSKLFSKSSSSSSSQSSPRFSKRCKEASSASSSSSSSFDQASTATTQCSTSKNSSLLLWAMFLIHVGTSMPQELYKYFQLRIDFNDEIILDNYLTASLIQPMLKAKPYYALQLLYVSEFTIMPIVFILFYLCSLKSSTRPTRSESDADIPGKPSLSMCVESICFKYLQTIFYDPELSKSKDSRKYFLKINEKKTKAKKTPILLINDELKHQDDSLLPSAMFNRENILINNGGQQPLSFPIVNHQQAASNIRPSPFDLGNSTALNSEYNSSNNANLVHIIQHPSWRINIKQQQHQQKPSKEECRLNNHMPFSYMKNNSYKS